MERDDTPEGPRRPQELYFNISELLHSGLKSYCVGNALGRVFLVFLAWLNRVFRIVAGEAWMIGDEL